MLCLAPGSLLSGETVDIPELCGHTPGQASTLEDATTDPEIGLPLTDSRALDTVLGPVTLPAADASSPKHASGSSHRSLSLVFGPLKTDSEAAAREGSARGGDGGEGLTLDKDEREEVDEGLRSTSLKQEGGAAWPSEVRVESWVGGEHGASASSLHDPEARQVDSLDPWHTFVLWG